MMIRKSFFAGLIVLMFISMSLYAQVGINTENPSTNTELEVVSPHDNKGIMIPRMSETERDAILIDTIRDNSLMIYNTDEDCYNYFSLIGREWQSICGKLGKADFEITDCDTIQVFGQYLSAQSLGTGNYIKIIVEVYKPGSYTVEAIPDPDNGYYFFATGEFLTAGTYALVLQGAGTPRNFTPPGGQGDLIRFSLNGIDASCNNVFVKVEDSSLKPLYSLNCSSVQVNGVYVVNKSLDITNTITLQLTDVDPAAFGATWMIETNTVDGIKFTGAGIIGANPQTITLYGSGKPTSYREKNLTITGNSQSDVTECTASVIIAYKAMKILSMGGYRNEYGYSFNGTAASHNMLMEPRNYGLLPESRVKVENIVLTRNGEDFLENTSTPAALASLQTALAENPDIVITGVYFYPSQAMADELANYLKKGGVLLMYMENVGGSPIYSMRILSSVFGGSYTSSDIGAAGNVYKFSLTDEEPLNGPFGDIRGLQWGEDASPTEGIWGLPSGDITTYSNGYDIATNTGDVTATTVFRHKTLNLIFVCDGGFNSNNGGTSATICPFKIDANNFPISKIYGRSNADLPVYNSVFTANAIAWAMRQAQFSGINRQP